MANQARRGPMRAALANRMQAVVNIAPELYQCLISNPAAMRALVLNHVLVEPHTPDQLVNGGNFPTMAGTTHTFQAMNGGFIIDNQVRVPVSAWYPTLNGHVYLIDTVLVPSIGASNEAARVHKAGLRFGGRVAVGGACAATRTHAPHRCAHAFSS